MVRSDPSRVPTPEGSEAPRSILEQISTRWGSVTNPMQFVLRYGPAVRKYLAALVGNSHDAEDVGQDFFMRVVRSPVLMPERVKQGRFRDYLKAVLRNSALDHFRKRSATSRRVTNLPEEPPSPMAESPADAAWNLEWRSILLNRCWEQLETTERRTKDNFGYSALRLAVDFPDESSPELAERLGARIGRSVTPEAFRKQVSRARKSLAQHLVDEVRQTLRDASAEGLLEELAELKLMEYVRPYLPEQWREARFD